MLTGRANELLKEPLSVEGLLKVLDQLIVEAQARFGSTNSVLFQYHHLRAACLLQGMAAKSDCHFTISAVETLREIARLAFSVETIFFGEPRTFQGSAPSFSFPKIAFTMEYVRALERFEPLISKALTFSPSHQFLLNRFSYVIGTALQWRHCVVPQAISDVLLGNRNQTFSPFHPVLAHDLNLTVACAGEVAFYWPNQTGQPEIVFINNISGHFRPKLSASELDSLARTALGLSSTTSVFSLANDGFQISGPLTEDFSLLDEKNP